MLIEPRKTARLATIAWCLSCWLLLCTTAWAQFGQGGFQIIPELSAISGKIPKHDFKVTARLRPSNDQRFGLLEVTATMNEAWHLYSMTQPPGGSQRTEIKLDPGSDFQLLGSFAPDHASHDHFDEVLEAPSEEFTGKVSWTVPVAISKSIDEIRIGGFLSGQVCADGGSCVPLGERMTRFQAEIGPALTASESAVFSKFRLPKTHADFRAWLSRDVVAPGEQVMLYVAIDAEKPYHIYAFETKRPSPFQQPTMVFANLPSGWKTETIKSSAPTISETSPFEGDPLIRYYDGPSTIAIPIRVSRNAQAKAYTLSGNVAFQTCATTCDFPTAAQWQVELVVQSKSSAVPAKLKSVQFVSEPGDYDAVVEALKSQMTQADTPNAPSGPAPDHASSANLDNPIVESADPPVVGGLSEIQGEGVTDQASLSLWKVLGYGFLGGFVLNFMPCVLPVIGLKIMSFVDQAGSDRVRVFSLNASYALGMLAVFWVLAVLAAAPAFGLSEQGFGWGQQFNYQGFAIPLVCLVFIMGLSFLGVWEIPIPGFATSNTASELTTKEGYSGAFFKGIITTVLATPCSAPGLATAYGWAVQSGSVAMAFLIFTVMGLGMAIPYLLIGAFPSLIRFLPKPGAWMDTFKQIMGFVLLGTVIFLLRNIQWQLLLSTVAMMFGLWFACWWIGRVPMTAEPAKRRRAWAIAGVIALISATICFGRSVDAFGRNWRGIRGWAEQEFQYEVDRIMSERGRSPVHSHNEDGNELPWEPFSMALLNELRESQTAVMVDFTAKW